MKDWGLSQGLYTTNAEYQALLELIVKKYFIPYYKVQTDCGYTCSLVNNYPRYRLNGQSTSWVYNSYVIILQNGQMLQSYCGNNDGVLTSFFIAIDLNGNKKPNVYGKDVFVIMIDPQRVKPLFYGYKYAENSWKNNCKIDSSSTVSGYMCGWVIQQNGWKMPDDYPW